jgi:hypothetical protein
MRETVAKCVVAMGAGFALLVAQQAAPAPVQPVAISSSGPQVQPDLPVGSVPVADVDSGARPRVKRAARPRYQGQPVQAQSTDAQAAAAAQRQRDERLLEEQEAASQRQQEELNQDIEQTLKMQQEMQAEPRIQDNPGPPTPTSPE